MGKTKTRPEGDVRPFGFIARSRAPVFEVTHSTGVHASGVSHGTETRTRGSFVDSKRYKIERIIVHYPLFRET